MKHVWKRVKNVYLFPKYIRDDKEFIIESSPAGVFNVYDKKVAFLLSSNSLKLLNYSVMNTNFMFIRSGVL